MTLITLHAMTVILTRMITFLKMNYMVAAYLEINTKKAPSTCRETVRLRGFYYIERSEWIMCVICIS